MEFSAKIIQENVTPVVLYPWVYWYLDLPHAYSWLQLVPFVMNSVTTRTRLQQAILFAPFSIMNGTLCLWNERDFTKKVASASTFKWNSLKGKWQNTCLFLRRCCFGVSPVCLKGIIHTKQSEHTFYHRVGAGPSETIIDCPQWRQDPSHVK